MRYSAYKGVIKGSVPHIYCGAERPIYKRYFSGEMGMPQDMTLK